MGVGTYVMMKKKLLNIQGITYLKLQWKINVDMRYFGREKLAVLLIYEIKV